MFRYIPAGLAVATVALSLAAAGVEHETTLQVMSETQTPALPATEEWDSGGPVGTAPGY